MINKVLTIPAKMVHHWFFVNLLESLCFSFFYYLSTFGLVVLMV